MRALASFLLAALASCGTCIQYTENLRTSPDRSVFVRFPAQAGGMIGTLAGIPVDIVALPVTYPVYLVQRANDPQNVDFSDSIMFPDFALRQAGSLVGVPFDVIEFAVYRAWAAERSRTSEEQQELERRLDAETLPRYPVTPAYPIKEG